MESSGKTKISGDSHSRSFWLVVYLFLTLVVAAGIWLRFQNLDRKAWWVDEVQTSLLIGGVTEQEMFEDIAKGAVVKPESLIRYEVPTWNKGWFDTVAACAHDDPKLSPLYYLTAREWARVFGSTPEKLRLLSVVAGILAIPALYWLSLELFEDKTIAIVGAALLAVSPMAIAYSQHARVYSLLVCAMLGASAILLRALRTRSRSAWLVYGLIISISMYLSLLFAAVIAAHAAYVFYRCYRSADKYGVFQFTLSLSMAVLISIPWTFALVSHPAGIIAQHFWTQSVTLFDWIKNFALNLTRTFADVDRTNDSLYWISGLSLLVLCIFSIWTFIKSAPRMAAVFLLFQILISAGPLVIADFAIGGMRALVVRFLLPVYLGLILIVAFVINQMIRSCNRSKSWTGLFILCGLVLIGVYSSYEMVQAKVWWDRGISKYDITAAGYLNALPKPLLIAWYPSNALYLERLIALTNLLSPNISIMVSSDPNFATLPGGFSDYLLFRPTVEFRNRIQQKYRCGLRALDGEHELWRLDCAKI
jgi:uncharacterized membrane protein